ncbi:MAG: phosphatidylserine decarboxylase family protein [Bacteroidales bacterium]|nr:phosphatidylserine decarboxylase family protein [Bacteroidales bacterium]
MHIYKKAYSFLFMIGIALLLFNFVLLLCRINITQFYILTFCSIILYVFIIAFFRIPERIIIPDEKLILSPADGKIMNIDDVFEDEYLKAYCKKISIFMSVFNVHQNRIPVSGKVTYLKHHPGKYLVAWHPKSSLKNERNSLVIETYGGQQVLIRQIAGKVARRIICNLKSGDTVKQGDELGFIMFGSRVDVFLPSDTQVFVKLNDKVKGTVTVLGHL